MSSHIKNTLGAYQIKNDTPKFLSILIISEEKFFQYSSKLYSNIY